MERSVDVKWKGRKDNYIAKKVNSDIYTFNIWRYDLTAANWKFQRSRL